MRSLSYLLMFPLFTSLALAASAPPPKDFVSDAIKGDNSEIMLGNYAADHGQSSGIKQFGRTLATDHTKAKDQMAQLAQQLSVTPPTDPMPEASDELKKLQGLHGSDFDKEFASYMVNDHKDDIGKFTAEADSKNGPASRLAARQLPVLRKHLRIAQSLQKGS